MQEFLASQPCFNTGPLSPASRQSAAQADSADPDRWVPCGTGPLSQNPSYAHSAEFGQQKLNFLQFSWQLSLSNPGLTFFFFLNKFIYLFIYFWLRWAFVAVRGLSLVAVSRGYSLLQCVGFSLQWLLLLRSTGSRHAGFSSCGTQASVVVAHGLSCSVACGIFPDQGLNPRPDRKSVV